MKTYHVILTRASDGLKIQGNLAEDANGAPLLQLGSSPYSADRAEKRRLLIPDLAHGSGELIGFDRRKYRDAVAGDPTVPGYWLGGAGYLGTLLTGAYPLTFEDRRGAIFQHPDAGRIIVTPLQIYEGTTLVDTAPVGSHFTGSYAIFGDRTFFGLEVDSTRVSTAACRVRTGGAVGTYVNAGFAASYFTLVGAKLFRCVVAATNPKISLSFTDATGTSSPTFSTAYTYPTQLFAMDMVSVGPNPVIALGGVLSMAGELVTLDIAGTFTNLLPRGFGERSPIHLVPFNGGYIVLTSGPLAKALFLADLATLSPLGDETTLSPIGTLAGAFGSQFTPNSALAEAGVKGGSLATIGDLAIVSVGDLRFWWLKPTPEGVYAHDVTFAKAASEATFGTILNTLAARLYVDQTLGLVYEAVVIENAVPVDNLWLLRNPMWNGLHHPVQTGGYATASSRLDLAAHFGDTFALKQFLAIQGGWESGVGNIKASLDHATAPTTVVAALATPGEFYVELDETWISRSLRIRIDDTVANDSLLAVRFPIAIDYLVLPHNTDQITLGLLAGSLQITRGGTFTKQARKEVLDNVQAALEVPSRWTLSWWDGRADWQVIAVASRSVETEEAGRPGEGAAIVSLTLEHLRDTTTLREGG